MKIKYSKYGYANRFGDTLVFNEHLPKNKYLYQKALDHEQSHTSDKIAEDILIDFKYLVEISGKEWYEKIKFMLRHPLSLLQASPFWIYEKKIKIDLAVLIIYFIVGSFFIILSFLNQILRFLL